jgi:NHLM bacteriocin system ABC transporter ATP-binding protein
MGVILVASVVTLAAGVRTVRTLQPLQVLEGTIFGLMVQLLHGVTKLRVAGAEQRAFAYWRMYFQQQQGLRQRVQTIQDHMTVVNTVLPTLAAVVLFWWATRLWAPTAAGALPPLTTGTFLAFYVAFGTCINGATGLSNAIIDVLEIATLWERAKPILEAPPEVDAGKSDPGHLSGKVALEHVTFRYRAHGPRILDDVSIAAEPGEFIALVGPSGGGKSTIFRLLLGFETPEAGTICYDDQEVSRLDVYAVRRQMGVVLQQSRIMASTIFENIASGAVITMDEAWEAARAAGLEEDLTAMPMGMHTYLSEGGGTLSGGQRQRLLIARALVCKPRLLLLDEATSALDNYTQALVTASLDRLCVTRIVIAHRLSTIRHATRIYVLAGGRIVQQGRFEELAQQEGLFAQLMARQMLTA